MSIQGLIEMSRRSFQALDAAMNATGQNVVSDVEKATQYSTDRERIEFVSFDASFKGDHNTYHVSYNDGQWDSDNPYFRTHGVCSHSMAMERILKGMVKPVSLQTESSD